MLKQHQDLLGDLREEIKTLRNLPLVKQYQDLDQGDPRNAQLIQQLQANENVARYVVLKNNINTIHQRYDLAKTVGELRARLQKATNDLYVCDGELQRITAANLPAQLDAYDAGGNFGPSLSQGNSSSWMS